MGMLQLKSMIEFIDSCHGEIAHDGQPFAKKLKGNLVFSIILFIAGCAAIIYFGGIKVTETGLSVFDSFMFAPALIAPLAYFWGSLNVRYELSICPICGRMNTVYRIKSSKDFGEKNDGVRIFTLQRQVAYNSKQNAFTAFCNRVQDGQRVCRDLLVFQNQICVHRAVPPNIRRAFCAYEKTGG